MRATISASPVEAVLDALRAGDAITLVANGRDETLCAAIESHSPDTILARLGEPPDLRLAAPAAYLTASRGRSATIPAIVTHERGVLREPSVPEAAVDLARLAGLSGAVYLGRPPGDAAEGVVVDVAEVVSHRLRREGLVRRVTDPVTLPTPHGDFQATGYLDVSTDSEHVAIVNGYPFDESPTLVRIHSECLTGDVFGSRRCDCGEQLHAAMERIHAEGGVIVYLRGHEGRGIGLHNKLRAYRLQDSGHDTVDANLELGFPPDLRDFGVAGEILRDLGLRSIRLMTNNPVKPRALALPRQAHVHNLEIEEVVPIQTEPNAHNVRYLAAKAERMGHTLHIPEK
ncbi:MAG TPA: GTP cyclohydrolase II [Chloroflexota bacterium]|nr:GTP cyclohydrolase II [Chloroflexota bacterium]